jgi:N-carbamoylputrescine amidase
LVREAATEGAQVILLQELFETPYFCKDQEERRLSLAAELGVVLPISFFERSNNRLEKSR